jgi:hypothetical protein
MQRLVVKRLVNLTEHPIRIKIGDGHDTYCECTECVLVIEPSGLVARCEALSQDMMVLSCERHTIPVAGVSFGSVYVRDAEGNIRSFPSEGEAEGAIYLVSSLVQQQLHGRGDVMAPDSGVTAIRKDGQVWAVRRLVRYLEET